jgi:predicted homoserine dehydrogenase-like protein
VIVVDRALQARAAAGDPLRVGLVGAGFMGRGIAHQIISAVPGMSLVGIANRDPDKAAAAFAYAGVDDVGTATSAAEVDRAAAAGRPIVTDDPGALATSDAVEVLIEVTGTVEHAAGVVLQAIDHGTHVVLMNAELDGTVGPLLAHRARQAGVVYTACDGDQPGVEMNLYRFVRGIGVEPLVCGNIKGLHDPYRNPTTQEGFAKRWGQRPTMVTSFADGTKISFEQAIVANATGMTVPRRGMNGFDAPGPIEQVVDRYDVDELRALGGVVDYVVGASPGPGVYVLGAHDDPRQRHYLDLYKLGSGPLYAFYTPYHLCHFEVPLSAARAALLGDVVLAPAGGPVVEVVATAKTDLTAGTVLDGFGGYHTYGLAERRTVARDEGLLPMGLAEGCTLLRDVAKDAVLTADDVVAPPGRLVDRLWQEQEDLFRPARADLAASER